MGPETIVSGGFLMVGPPSDLKSDGGLYIVDIRL